MENERGDVSLSEHSTVRDLLGRQTLSVSVRTYTGLPETLGEFTGLIFMPKQSGTMACKHDGCPGRRRKSLSLEGPIRRMWLSAIAACRHARGLEVATLKRKRGTVSSDSGLKAIPNR